MCDATSYTCFTQGARELVAKALALECLRGAHRQRRACYLYAFSGPRESLIGKVGGVVGLPSSPHLSGSHHPIPTSNYA